MIELMGLFHIELIAPLRILRPINNSADASMDEGAKAHEARFESGIERRFGKTVIILILTGVPKGFDFGMGGGICRFNDPVTPSANNLPIFNNNGPNRNFPKTLGAPSFFEGEAHKVKILFVRHGG
jgi:hypothetical protein